MIFYCFEEAFHSIYNNQKIDECLVIPGIFLELKVICPSFAVLTLKYQISRVFPGICLLFSHPLFFLIFFIYQPSLYLLVKYKTNVLILKCYEVPRRTQIYDNLWLSLYVIYLFTDLSKDIKMIICYQKLSFFPITNSLKCIEKFRIMSGPQYNYWFRINVLLPRLAYSLVCR